MAVLTSIYNDHNHNDHNNYNYSCIWCLRTFGLAYVELRRFFNGGYWILLLRLTFLQELTKTSVKLNLLLWAWPPLPLGYSEL